MTNGETEKLRKMRFFWFLGFLPFCPRIRILLLLPNTTTFARIQPLLPEYNNFCPNKTTFARIQQLCPKTTTLPD